ncbi:MAG: HU family DNA-binding protein [Bacteroidaceae bacterium]|nr:HU family DNA-binding protein [Bacteroidaceae bacterium]
MADKIQKGGLCSILMKESTMADTEIRKILDAFFMQIMKGLEEERYVKVKGLGVFKLIDVESRRSVDVNTKEYIEIPEHRKITFTPESALKELINKPFAHFETIEIKSDGFLEKTPSSIEKEMEADQIDEETEENYADKEMDVAMSEEKPDTPTIEGKVNIEEFTQKETLIEEPFIEEDMNVEEPFIEEDMNVEEPFTEEEANVKEEPIEEENTVKEGVENLHKESVAVKPQDTIPHQAPVRLIERREELRKLDIQLEEENRKNKIALTIISILMFLVLLFGLLFILAPEFLEQLLY